MDTRTPVSTTECLNALIGTEARNYKLRTESMGMGFFFHNHKFQFDSHLAPTPGPRLYRRRGGALTRDYSRRHNSFDNRRRAVPAGNVLPCWTWVGGRSGRDAPDARRGLAWRGAARPRKRHGARAQQVASPAQLQQAWPGLA